MDLINTEIKREPRVLKIIHYPNSALSQVCAPVISSIPDDQGLQQFLDDMVATLQYYRAIGLAANQVGASIRALVVQDEREEPVKMINPVLKDSDGTQFESEGCLSVPGLSLRIRRPNEAVVEYFDETGELRTTVFTGLLARAVTHEMEHLSGKMFFDGLSALEKSNALRKFKHVKRKFKAAGVSL